MKTAHAPSGAGGRFSCAAAIVLRRGPAREYVPLSEEGRRGFERLRAEQRLLPARKAAEKAS